MDNKEIIIQATIELIHEKGEKMNEITVRDICKRANVGLGLVNYHFDNKEKLIKLCVEQMVNGIVDNFRSIREKTEGLSPFEKMEYLGNMTLTFLFEHYAVSKTSILTDMNMPKEDDNTYRTFRAYLPLVAACRPDWDDISKKVLAGRMTRSRQGKFGGGQTPLGLMRDLEDRGHLIIDPETAPVIRKIYDLALDGWGCMRIAKRLMDDKEPITRVKANTEYDVNYYSWGSARISHILRNPFYKGAHLVCRTHQKGIRSNTYDFIPREEWEVIENCHEAIVTPEEWGKVQEIVDRRTGIMQGNSCPYYNIFHGLIYCATCGKSMQARYEKVGRMAKDRRTGKEREPIDKAYYICQTYNRLGKNACTSHKVEARDLYNLVLKDIQDLAATALTDKEAFYGRLSRRMEKQYLADMVSLKKEYEDLAQRNQEIDDTFISLYADKAKGILTEKRFLKLTDAMEKEQEGNQKRMQEIAALIREEEHSEGDVQMFFREIGRYAVITELDETVLNRLIKRILIGEPKKVDGVKTQEVRIVYNFVGEL
ncbi:MAG: DUF4368 domain-containing protein [Lachnospiraceae bacterium]|nr:DUF4368 domain-containing protein [Lachnospiraceae bacterium]